MKFKSCGKCDNGYFYKEDGPKAYIAIECECHKKWQKESDLERKYRSAGFDMRNYNYSPRTYIGNLSATDKDRIINYVKQFESSDKVRSAIVYLYGPNGTQKSTFMCWVGKSLLAIGFNVKYMSMAELLSILMDSEDFDKDKAEIAQAKIEKLEKTDLVILDESFDKDKMKLWKSGYQMSFIDKWIRRRVQQLNKGIFFISNVELDKIESQGFSHSIQDFVSREVLLHKCYLKFLDNYIANSSLEYDGSLF